MDPLKGPEISWAAAKGGGPKRGRTSLILRLFAFVCVCSRLSAF